jgi:hypothetical protein
VQKRIIRKREKKSSKASNYSNNSIVAIIL